MTPCATGLIERRLRLHELALRDLRDENYVDAARNIRRLLMLLPAEHGSRGDLLRVLAFAEGAR